jgi:hypothetical protein
MFAEMLTNQGAVAVDDDDDDVLEVNTQKINKFF